MWLFVDRVLALYPLLIAVVSTLRRETCPMSFLTEPWCHPEALAASLLGKRPRWSNGERTLSSQ